MSRNGNGADSGPLGDADAPPPKTPIAKPPGKYSPEQTCLGCLVAVGVVVLNLIVWGVVYFLNEPSFRTGAPPTPAPGASAPARRGTP